jgi:predicted nucleic acid-binding protein
LNVVDTSAWLEYFADGPNASFFAEPIERGSGLLVPSLTIYEVFKRVALQRDEHAALQAIAIMQQGEVINLHSGIAISAARISLAMKLPMADSIILATARAYDATLWTQDADFIGIERVQYREHRG